MNFLSKGRAYREESTNLYRVAVPIPIETREAPDFEWKGGRIPLSLWNRIASFLKWTNVEYGSEALVQLYYSQSSGEWTGFPMPQWVGTGMTVSQITSGSEFDACMDIRARNAELDGMIPIGSVHHHCSAGAFQSGTDEADERDKPGLHITLGKMDESRLDFHSRVSFAQNFYDARLCEWFDFGEWQSTVDRVRSRRPEIAEEFATALLVEPDTVQWPEWWESMLIRKPIVPLIGAGAHYFDYGGTDSEMDTGYYYYGKSKSRHKPTRYKW
jgi:hypothetical protein